MSRRSPNDPVVINARLPRGEAGWWEIIKRLNDAGPWSIADVDGETNQRRRSIAAYIRRLVKARIARVVRVDRGGRGKPRPVHRLVTIPKEAPRLRHDGTPAEPRAQDRLWRAIRTLRQFTQRELAFAATMDEPVPLSTARWYANKLLEAGYLVEQPRSARNVAPVYRLKPGMNTGPKAPHVLEVQAVWDPNLGKIMGEPLAEEAV